MSEIFNKILHEKSLNSQINNSSVYKIWADTYDDYVIKDLEYVGPRNLINFVLNYVNKNDIKLIFDFGCGTGLVGNEIKKIFDNFTIDGLDISEEMITKCRKKCIYTNIWNINLEYNNLPEHVQYDLILSCGAFLEGHASLKLINKIIDGLKPAHLFIFTIRSEYLEKNNYDFNKYIIKNKRVELLEINNMEYLKHKTCKVIVIKKIF
jgi:predicted TPR repeat methyltransferase